MSLIRIWIPSPNYSASRSRTQVLVVHSAEGATTFHELGNYLSSPAAQVSSHVGIDDTPGQIGEFVHPQNKSWTAMNANDWGEHAELCGFAAWSRSQWLQHPTMLSNTASWLREESVRYGVPLVKINGADIRAGKKGVCGHADVVAAGAGGDHWDPGPNFPWDIVLSGGPVPPKPVYVPPMVHPAFFGRLISLKTPMMQGVDVETWQQQMKNRGWNIDADGWYGPASAAICRQFQSEKGLDVDGIVGPITWNEAWTAPVT